MEEQTRELSKDELLNRYKKKAAIQEISTRRSPFKFLDSYDESDRDIFFGRDVEIEELLRLYHGPGHVLIYGESGSGKSSLVQCGLCARIPEADALFIPMRIRAEGLPGVCRDICAYATKQLGETVEYSSEMNLIDALVEARALASRPVVLFFDQFEELLIFHNQDARRQFAKELAKIPEARINVKVIIGIRQDFLAQLTELEDILEGLFDNRFWLRRMSRENAAQAVVQACATCDVKIELALAESIVKRLDTTGQGIELPYLQVVMDRLYRQAVEANPDQPVISADDVEKLGDVAQILGTFLVEEVEKLSSPDQGRQVLKAFVSREGTRRSLTREAIAQDASGFGGEIPPVELDTILSRLVKVRVLRENADAGVFELRHDTLAATVFSWISEVEKELIEVRDNLVNRFNEYLARNNQKSALLDQGFIDYVSVYKSRLNPLLDNPQREYLANSEKELSRRKRVKQLSIFGGIVGSMLIAFGIIAYILYERGEAERRRFEEARKTVNRFFVTVSEDTLLNQPGMQDLRVTLLEDAGDFFERYLDPENKPGDSPDDAALSSDDKLKADLARTNYFLGQLAAATKSKTEDASNVLALEKYALAKGMQTELSERYPHDETLLYDLGNTLNAIGIAYDNSKPKQPDKDTEEYKKELKRLKQNALQAYNEALRCREKLATDVAEYQRKYASTKMNIGILNRAEAYELAQRFSREPEKKELREQAVSFSRTGVIQLIDEAQSIRRKCLDTLDTVDDETRETQYRIHRDLAMGDWNLAQFEQKFSNELFKHEGDNRTDYSGYDLAVEHYESAIETCLLILGKSESSSSIKSSDKPNDFEIQYVLGESYLGLGQVKYCLADQNQNLQEARKILDRLVFFNNEIKYKGAIGRVEHNFGNLYENWSAHIASRDPNPEGCAALPKKTQVECLDEAILSYKKAIDHFANVPEHARNLKYAEDGLKQAKTQLDKLNSQ